MNEDAELLRRYSEEKSEEAFAELVRRHLSLVYFAALRQVGGDAHRAQDVAQSVFTDLARKARPLSRHAVLTGWLYTSTHFAAAKMVRTEQRRVAREQEAQVMQENSAPFAPEVAWDRLRPVLDDVMLKLNERDREAVLLRYFEGRPFADVGEKLRLSEDAARMRVDRALDKLRLLLRQRGVSSTTAALGLALAHQVSGAAPAGLAGLVTGAALSGAAAGGGASASLFALFAMNKLPIGLTSALAVASVSGLVVQDRANAQLRHEITELRIQNQEIVPLQQERQRLAHVAAEVQALRQDDVELGRLREELVAVKARLAEAAQRQADAIAAKRAREADARARLARDPAVEINTLDQMPRPRFQARPVYPFEMKRAGISGKVTVSFIVGSNGEVANATAVSSSRSEFEAAAVEAVSQWKFEPGTKGGRLVNTRMQVPIVFGQANTESGAATPQSEKSKVENWF